MLAKESTCSGSLMVDEENGSLPVSKPILESKQCLSRAWVSRYGLYGLIDLV
jgi:hypothetical protein